MLEWLIFLFSLILTWLLRQWALKKNLMDHPNERSSHTIPTPRGGGLAIVLAFYCGISVLFWQGKLDTQLFMVSFTALPIALISFIDDIYTLNPSTRLCVQIGSGLVAVYLLRDHIALDFAFIHLQGWWLMPVWLIALVWITNLYNFLDGIDGYAATEAIFVSLGAYLFYHSEIFLLLTGAVAGFLVFNWQKASIFMGDVGSAFLGFLFGIFALYFSKEPGSGWIWLTLLALFWFDATITLYRRFRKGEKLSEAHKKHAYQRIVQAGFPHWKTVIFGMAINLIGLLFLWFFHESVWLPAVCFAYFLLLYAIIRIVDRHKPFCQDTIDV